MMELNDFFNPEKIDWEKKCVENICQVWQKKIGLASPDLDSFLSLVLASFSGISMALPVGPVSLTSSPGLESQR